MRTAFCLSGGGSKGDFEVGALRFLFEQGISPDILTTTSVGTVNGAKVAEGATGFPELEQIWLTLEKDEDMAVMENWLQAPEVAPLKDLLIQFATNGQLTFPKFAVHPMLASLDGEILRAQPLSEAERIFYELGHKDPTWGVFADIGQFLLYSTVVVGAASALPGILNIIQQAKPKGIFNFSPIRSLAAASFFPGKVATWSQGANPPRRWLMAMIGLETGKLRYVTESGEVLERDCLTKVLHKVESSVCQPIIDEIAGLKAEVVDLQSQLSVAAPQEKPGIVRSIGRLKRQIEAKQIELTACKLANPPQDLPVKANLIDGIIASSSIPAIFPPVRLGNEFYIDGGIREQLPLESALKLGAERIFAINASKADSDEKANASDNILSIMTRGLFDLAINEVAFSDLEPYLAQLGNQLTVIQPRVDIHQTFTIYPAFVRNRMAYGYMCAADELFPPANAARARAIADEISVLRFGIARLECWFFGKPVPPSMTLLLPPITMFQEITTALTALRTSVKNLIAERVQLGAKMPAGNGDWDDPQTWHIDTQGISEVHPWKVPVADDALFVQITGNPINVNVADPFNIGITLTNTGRSTWKSADGYTLGETSGNGIFGTTAAALPNDVPPLAQVTFNIAFSAPWIIGNHATIWKMKHGNTFFGGEAPVSITVLTANPRPVKIDATLKVSLVGPVNNKSAIGNIKVSVNYNDGAKEPVPNASVFIDGKTKPANQNFNLTHPGGDLTDFDDMEGAVSIPGRQPMPFVLHR